MGPSGTTVLVHEWVTGGGLAGEAMPPSLAAEGSAMRRALAREFAAAGLRVRVTLDARFLEDDPGPWSVVRLVGTDAEGLIPAAREADYTLAIAPETAGVLAGLARAMEAEGVRSLGCSAAAIDLAGDKARMARWLEDHGFETPASRVVVPASGLPRGVRFPAVLKPIDGAGAIDTYRIDGPDDLPPRGRAMRLALLQEYRPGVPMSASFLVDGGRAELVATGRQDVVIEGGRFVYRGGSLPVPCPAAVPSLVRLVESLPGLRGLVGVDFLWDPDRREAVVLEINPRPTTSVVGLCRLLPPGLLARAWLAACDAPGFEPPTPGTLAASIGPGVRADFEAGGRSEIVQVD
ncbi:carbamoyl phosphate synthase-like protein [Aquisphaera giovannonii]|uniref:Carbamoyl phosphate synthase-like protein n=1 Tax=Aquisphaera giovannonii TaxID=406548 RepID=A0A5B9WAR5_9BACT|nr:ATP-grasp domain-containing protein [Aquisphaera giovannonii]QEH37344.1 carbamoyl phosphate synthase-like protein [Aquisphaera giovannonii]